MSHIFIEQQPLIPVAMTLMVVNKVLMFYHLKTRRGVSNNTIDTYFLKSCEKGLIAKECIVMDAYLNFVF